MEELMRGGELMSFFDILMGGKFIAMKGGGSGLLHRFQEKKGVGCLTTRFEISGECQLSA
jgi:hypothetical protein